MPFCPKNKKRSSYCHGYRDASNVSLRSVLILFRILHVETMFGNEGEGFLHACISSLCYCPGLCKNRHLSDQVLLVSLR